MKDLRQELKSRFPAFYDFIKEAYYSGNRLLLKRMPHEIVFTKIYRTNAWGDKETHSGAGSNTINTTVVREKLPAIIGELGIRTLLDLPCGDFFWMSQVVLGVDRYLGADIVKELVEINREKYGSNKRSFVVLDILANDLPTVDLVLCRDCLPHFSFKDIERALHRIRKSNSRYLLTSTYTSRNENVDIVTGSFRPLNLQIAPFNFPAPPAIINEQCRYGNGIYADKSLALWEIKNLAG